MILHRSRPFPAIENKTSKLSYGRFRAFFTDDISLGRLSAKRRVTAAISEAPNPASALY